MLDYAIVCPGQGSQSPDMLELVAADPGAQDTLRVFSDTLGLDILAQTRLGKGLFENAFAQPALVAAAVAAWTALRPALPVPSLFAGYSVGEVSAWCCAGAWDVCAAAQVAGVRARLMDAFTPPECGMLAARGLPVATLVALGSGLYPAIVNESDHVVLAGTAPELAAAEKRLVSHNAWVRRLDVHVPSHTPLLETAAVEFGAWLQGMPMRAPDTPVLRGIDGRPCVSPEQGATALQRAVCEPIRWDECMTAIVEAGITVVLELGPGRALSNLIGQACPTVNARSLADFRSLRGAADWLLRQIDV